MLVSDNLSLTSTKTYSASMISESEYSSIKTFTEFENSNSAVPKGYLLNDYYLSQSATSLSIEYDSTSSLNLYYHPSHPASVFSSSSTITEISSGEVISILSELPENEADTIPRLATLPQLDFSALLNTLQEMCYLCGKLKFGEQSYFSYEFDSFARKNREFLELIALMPQANITFPTIPLVNMVGKADRSRVKMDFALAVFAFQKYLLSLNASLFPLQLENEENRQIWRFEVVRRRLYFCLEANKKFDPIPIKKDKLNSRQIKLLSIIISACLQLFQDLLETEDCDRDDYNYLIEVKRILLESQFNPIELLYLPQFIVYIMDL